MLKLSFKKFFIEIVMGDLAVYFKLNTEFMY